MPKDWQKFFDVVGGLARGVSEGMTIQRLLDMNDEDALTFAMQLIQEGDVAAIDSFDSLLYKQTILHYDANQRARLTRLYVQFKIAEFIRFEKFRGFPVISA